MLLQNAIYVPEDDLYLVSLHRHDFRGHKLRDGKMLCVDGGVGEDGYGRRVGDLAELDEAGRYIEFCLTDEDPFETRIAQMLLWGSAGKDGKDTMTFRPIKEWAYREDGVGHLRAILANVPNISPIHKRVVEYWLAKRAQEQGGAKTS
jgi:hypothetical protein